MAMSEKVKNRQEVLTADLKSCGAPLGAVDDDIEILAMAAAGTNGLPPDEKLQACAENIFNLCYLYIRDKQEARKAAKEAEGKATTWKDVLVRCAWQIVAVVAITVPAVVALFAYRPELAAVLKSLSK